MFKDEGGAYVLVLCDTCGKLAQRISRDQYAKAASISGFGFDECSACAKERAKRQAAEAKQAEAERKARAAEFKKWLRAHGTGEKELRHILPPEFYDEEDD